MTETCKHYYDTSRPTSTCTNGVPINVSVSATNSLGSGPISSPLSVVGWFLIKLHCTAKCLILFLFIDVNNSFVKVTIDSMPPVVTCAFLNQQGSSIKSCSVAYTISETCVIGDMLLLPQMKQIAQSVSNTVTVGFPISHTFNNHSGCFIATATNSTFTAMIQGSFNTGAVYNNSIYWINLTSYL